MKHLRYFLFSMQTTGVLLILFALSIGMATFIENDFGTTAAKAAVYNAWWFELMLAFLTINLIGSIFIHRMYRGEKWPALIFHVSFIVIIIGAAITRFFGYEGILHVREGKASDRLLSDAVYVQGKISIDRTTKTFEDRVLFSSIKKNRFSESVSIGNKDVKIKAAAFIPNATEEVMEAGPGEGEPILTLVVADDMMGMVPIFIRQGQTKVVKNKVFAFGETSISDAVVFSLRNDSLRIFVPDSLDRRDMMAGTEGKMPPGEYPLKLRNLYSYRDIRFVAKDYIPNARVKLVTDYNSEQPLKDVLVVDISVNDKKKQLALYGGKGYAGEWKSINMEGIKVEMAYGAKYIPLPFSIKLRDFQLERYPGSNSPSSYASEVTVIDQEKNLEMPYRIYMNNVLNYRGYRFFQSSYDQDEKGSILSVNRDMTGTVVTYIGYFLLTVGMILAMVHRNSRFRKSGRKSKELQKTSTTVAVFAGIMLSLLAPATTTAQDINLDSLKIDKEHAAKFGKLLVQDRSGRIEPINTLSSEIIRKITRKTEFAGMNPDQVLLSMLVRPAEWQSVELIKVKHEGLKEMIGTNSSRVAFNELVGADIQGGYLLSGFVDEAYRKKPARRDKFDKDVMHVDERVNVSYMVYTGEFMRIFPVPGDTNYTWITPKRAGEFFEGEEGLFVANILPMYYSAVRKGIRTGDWTEADEHLGYIRVFQEKYGSEIIPSEAKVRTEVLYNKFQIFKRLSAYYGLVGLILLIMQFVKIMGRKRLKWPVRMVSSLLVLGFIAHTAGLALRWYISGHAPWSNAYESMIYIAWATSLAGLLFARRSGMTLAATAVLSALILSVAHLNWLDPEITTLVPVLKSYWLIIHVAIITASYGFLGLGALMGFLNLILMIMKSPKNQLRIETTIRELTFISEMAIIAGLFMLTIGTFLGGVWANESWGRYWGWDPKETWALVTILVYSFVIHMKYIPGFKGTYAFNLASLISYSSVLMTYFGVNYYLSGLHSYAKGDPVPIPNFVYYTLGVIAVVAVSAWLNNRRVENKDELKHV